MAAEASQLTSASSITWASGKLFNGYVILTMNLPALTGVTYTRVALKDTRPVLRVPAQIKITIREGVYDTTSKIWRTDSLVPPGVTYSSEFYDSNDVKIADGPATFTVTASTYTLAPPALTDPA